VVNDSRYFGSRQRKHSFCVEDGFGLVKSQYPYSEVSTMAFKMTVLRIEIAVLLFLASHDKLGPLRGVLSGNDRDIWSFDNLNKDMGAKGNASNTWSPVGKGLYLDGTDGTYVKLKEHEKKCLEHPSDCDLTIGFFLKFWPPSALQIYSGIKMPTENCTKA